MLAIRRTNNQIERRTDKKIERKSAINQKEYKHVLHKKLILKAPESKINVSHKINTLQNCFRGVV